MAGASLTVTVDLAAADARLDAAQQALTSPRALLRELGEYLRGSTRARFASMSGPDGARWQALSPRYQRRKHRNADKILTLRGHLRSRIAYQLEGDDGVAVGSNLAYAAIHQFGGSIEIAARSQRARLVPKRIKREDGTSYVAQRFGKLGAKSGALRNVTLPAYAVTMPARPYLGLSAEDEGEILARTQAWLADIFGR